MKAIVAGDLWPAARQAASDRVHQRPPRPRTGLRVAIFGASGKTGRWLVRQALALDHQVTALARDPAALGTQLARLAVVRGDVRDPRAVEAVVAGQDAVLCALGGRDRAAEAAVWEGVRNIVRAMERLGVRRLVHQSAFGVGDSRDRAGVLLGRIILPVFLARLYALKERQEEEIRRSGLDWVIVRPVHLTDGAPRGRWRVLAQRGRLYERIARADVAACMLAHLSDDRSVRQAVCIAE